MRQLLSIENYGVYSFLFFFIQQLDVISWREYLLLQLVFKRSKLIKVINLVYLILKYEFIVILGNIILFFRLNVSLSLGGI